MIRSVNGFQGAVTAGRGDERGADDSMMGVACTLRSTARSNPHATAASMAANSETFLVTRVRGWGGRKTPGRVRLA